MQVNRAKFLQNYKSVFGNTLKEKTITTLDAILDTYDSNGEKEYYLEKLAYLFATVRHEVGSNMLPIVENLNYTSAKRIMQIWPGRFPTLESAKPYVNDPRSLGNKVYGLRLGNGQVEGFKYRGRGIGCQLTGRENYLKFGKLLGLGNSLADYPELALDVKIGAKILVLGCCKGMFTGRKLAHYINNKTTDYVNARAVVNADVELNGKKVAGDAEKFHSILVNSIL